MSASHKIRAPKPPATFPVDETTLVFAFRYALGRRSTAPGHMADQLKRHWTRLNTWTRVAIQREIEQAIRDHDVGAPYDADTWREILALPVGRLGAERVCGGNDGCGGVEPNSHS